MSKNTETKCSKLLVEIYRTKIFFQEADLRRLARVARLEKGFFVPPEPKLAFVIRIKGINKMHPKVRDLNFVVDVWIRDLVVEPQDSSVVASASVVQRNLHPDQQSHSDDASLGGTVHRMGLS